MSPDPGLTYTMPLEVYFQAAVVRGVLVTNQERLSNYLVLREGEEIFSLKDVTMESANRKPLVVGADEYLVYMREVFLHRRSEPAESDPARGHRKLLRAERNEQGAFQRWTLFTSRRCPFGSRRGIARSIGRDKPIFSGDRGDYSGSSRDSAANLSTQPKPNRIYDRHQRWSGRILSRCHGRCISNRD